jgi:hypothetical protein
MSDIRTGGPKPEDVGDTTGEPLRHPIVHEDDVTGVGRVRAEAEIEKRPDQEQPTAGYPREETGHFDPSAALPEGENPSDPEAYDGPEEGSDKLPSRQQLGGDRGTDEVPRRNV